MNNAGTSSASQAPFFLYSSTSDQWPVTCAHLICIYRILNLPILCVCILNDRALWKDFFTAFKEKKILLSQKNALERSNSFRATQPAVVYAVMCVEFSVTKYLYNIVRYLSFSFKLFFLILTSVVPSQLLLTTYQRDKTSKPHSNVVIDCHTLRVTGFSYTDRWNKINEKSNGWK